MTSPILPAQEHFPISPRRRTQTPRRKPEANAPDLFDFSVAGLGGLAEFQLADQTTPWSSRVGVGQFTVTEEALPTGWQLDSIACTGTTATYDLDAGTAVFTVVDDATVNCTVHNSELPPDYDDLQITKTATPSFARDYDWTINKVAREDRIEIPYTDGAEGTFTYDVTVTPSEPKDSNFKVTGSITVSNPNPIAFTGVDVQDVLDLPGATCDVPGSTNLTVAAGGTYELDYTCTVPNGTATMTGTNTATVTWDPVAFPGTSGSSQATAAVDFADATPAVTDASVVVTDDNIDLAGYDDGTQVGNVVHAVDGAATFTYNLEWPATAGECEPFQNTATITSGSTEVGTSTEHVELCAGLDLDVSKNVVHSFDRTYLWDISKVAAETNVTADPDTGIALFNYTVTATPVKPPNGWEDSAWAMSGTVEVSNRNMWLDITANITDEVNVGGGAVCTVEGGTNVLIPAGASGVEFVYTCTFSSQPSYTGTNTATATWADTLPTPNNSASGTAEVTSDGWSVTPINQTVTVFDDMTYPDEPNPVRLGTATWNADGDPKVFMYSLTREIEAGTCASFTNTAWISETGQEAEETVTGCRTAPLQVEKTAIASADRTYLWDIEKDVDQTSVTVDPTTGEATFNYTVDAIPNGFTDSGWSLGGEIIVTNPNSFEAVTVTVTDVASVEGGVQCTVVDGVDAVIGAGATVVFDYSCTFTGTPTSGQNTATVVSGGNQYTATADVEFDLDDETDKTVDVVDDKTDPANPVVLGQATWNDDGTATEFTYALTHEGVPDQCVDFTNKAWVEVTGDDPTAQQTVEVCIEAPLTVSKTATASYDRLYEWDIDKSVNDSDVTVDENGQATYTYTVDAVPAGYTDSGWEMSGTITVHNPNEFADGTITASVLDVTDVGGVCTVEDGTDIVLAPGATTVVDYSCTFEEEPEYDGTNTATVTWTDTDGAQAQASSTVPVEFEVDEVTDLTIEVWDDKTDPATPVFLGEATWTDEDSHQFTYDVTHQGVGASACSSPTPPGSNSSPAPDRTPPPRWNCAPTRR